MTDIAIRVENYILSVAEGYILSSAEGLSKLYRIGRAQSHGDSRWSQRHDTPSTGFTLSAVEVLRAGLRDAMSNIECGMWNVECGMSAAQ